jgi:hypothetical protein
VDLKKVSYTVRDLKKVSRIAPIVKYREFKIMYSLCKETQPNKLMHQLIIYLKRYMYRIKTYEIKVL